MKTNTSLTQKYLFGTVPLAQIKPTFIKVLLASVAVAGIIGIISLLSGEFGETQTKILATVILTSGLSIGMLIYLTVIGSPYQLLGFAGGIASIASFLLGTWLIWAEWSFFSYNSEGLLKSYTFSTIVAIAIAHTCLIVRLLANKLPLIRAGIIATIGCIGALTYILGAIIYGDYSNYDSLYRISGVLGILVLLGTIIIPVLARLQKK